MRALLLAAGFGTRLRPLTDTIPKCLVPIKGKPLLQIWLERMSANGDGPFLVNTHYLSGQVDAYLKASSFKDSTAIVHEESLKGTAGTLLANADFFAGEDGWLVHADNYCLADLAAFKRAHLNRPKHCLLSMLAFRTSTPLSCGILELDHNDVVQAFHEKVANPPGNLANGAVYILSAELIAMLRKEIPHVTDFSTEVLPRLLGKIYVWETKDTFMDIGTPEAYARANE